jgi:hypothetical protein
MKVTLDVPKTPADMTWRELLVLLAAETGRYHEVRPYLEAQPQVRAASRCTGGAWAITGEGGTLDVEATVAYVSQVSRPHASAQRKFRGRRPVTLGKALGLDDRALIHPFTGRPVQGPDSNGFDFSELAPELHEALLWAVLTGHSAWPQVMDLYTFSDEVFRSPLPKRWQLILDDYRAAKEAEEDSTRVITRYWPEGLSLDGVYDLASGTPGVSPQARRAPAIDHRAFVMEAASTRGTLRASGVGTTYTGHAYTEVRVSGVDITFSNVVVTGLVKVSGVRVRGTVLLVPGASVEDSGVHNSLAAIDITWADAAQRLGLG